MAYLSETAVVAWRVLTLRITLGQSQNKEKFNPLLSLSDGYEKLAVYCLCSCTEVAGKDFECRRMCLQGL